VGFKVPGEEPFELFAWKKALSGVMKDFIQTTFKTSDGVKLSYLRAGNGLPVILLHGFLASGEYFKSQAQILSEQYNVIVLDHRSHRESEKVPFGLKISRLSKDLFELVTALNLKRVSLLGHAMGAAVIWSYIELFGDAELSIAGNEVWRTGEWSFTLQGKSGGPIQLKGYWGAINAREGDTWKIRMLTFNVTPPPAAETK
jgi:pimeloyl-ACP methyl ester carboxylesterase